MWERAHGGCRSGGVNSDSSSKQQPNTVEFSLFQYFNIKPMFVNVGALCVFFFLFKKKCFLELANTFIAEFDNGYACKDYPVFTEPQCLSFQISQKVLQSFKELIYIYI